MNVNLLLSINFISYENLCENHYKIRHEEFSLANGELIYGNSR